MTFLGSISKRVLVLPRGISRDVRTPFKTGRGDFWIRRQGDARNLVYDQKIHVIGHILIVVTSGFVRLKIDGFSLTVREGQAVLLSDIEGEVSELVGVGEGSAEFSWFFFNDALLAKTIPLADWPLQRFYHYALHPCAQDVIEFLPEEVRRADISCNGEADKFVQRLFLGAYQSGFAPVVKLLVNRVMIPRFKIRLFVENLIFLERGLRYQFCELFPGGFRALRRELGRLSFPSLEGLLARRRRALRIAVARRKRGLSDHQSQLSGSLAGTHPSGSAPLFFPEVESEDRGRNSRENMALTFAGGYGVDHSTSGALPRDDEERRALRLVQQEQVLEILSSKLSKLPGIERYAMMLAAA